MSTETVRADWISGQMYLLRDHNDFPVVMTQPNGVSGADLLPMSLIGCASWDIVDIIRKQRQRITGLAVTAVSERDDAPPWRFRRIDIVYRIRGRGLSADKVRRAVDLAERKYCSVFETLRSAVEISSRFELEDEEERT